MSDRKYIIPEFGPLAGMRVISSGSIIAMPFAASMLAQFGAEVIHLERPGVGDTLRGLAPFAKGDNGKTVSTSWAQDARNKLSMTLEVDLKHPEVKEIFFGLIKEADVFMENMVWIKKFGIYDEELLKINPRLVICHVSGYGNPAFGGLPEFCDKASYDMIGQAMSGWMNMNGEAGKEPLVAKPWLNDYVSAITAAFGIVTAYSNVQRTGKGQVVDVAQFEAMAMCMADTFVSYTMGGLNRSRTGNKATAFQPYGLFKSKDDYYVALGCFGPGVYNRFVKGVGWDTEYFNFKDIASSVEAVASPKGREFDQKVIDFCAARTAQEIEDEMAKNKIPCSRVNNAVDCINHPHFQSRGNFVKYVDQTTETEITAFGIVPKMSATPGQVWRGAATMGQDTDAVLKTILGYDDAKIAELKEKKLI